LRTRTGALGVKLAPTANMVPFRAIALDYDGTLTTRERPSEEVLAALRETRASGMKLLLVTGRILSELRRDFPEVGDYFDAVIAENGAVTWSEGAGVRALVPAVSRDLEVALVARDVPLRRGDVLFATDANYDGIVLDEIARLGLDCQLVRNRGALMILPAGVSKGTGLSEALGELGVSHHNAIGVGDAENDHALLEACEIGVAVGNAIEALKKHADVVLSEPNGAGVVRYLRDLVRGGGQPIAPTRWKVAIGTHADGSQVTLPASGINVLIAGGSGSGKSYLAGLLAEQLARLGYSICVVDPEGDHTNLGHLRGIVTLGGREELPSVPQLGRLLKGRFGGVVVDLSLTRSEDRETYTAALLEHMQQRRASTGLPHWIFLDEAHVTLGRDARRADDFNPAEKGFCLVTYRPTALAEKALRETDVLFVLPGSETVARELLSPGRVGARVDVDQVASLVKELEPGQALMITLGREVRSDVVLLGARRSQHVRHWHKYVHGYLAPRLHFVFRDDRGLTGRSAANLEDFHREVQVCPATVLAHHLAHGDFSRWISHVLRDASLASAIAELESCFNGRALDLEETRDAVTQALEQRYGESEEASISGHPSKPAEPAPGTAPGVRATA
jgi:hydroxymethylpyrimidine pyrophosphatase-like HAD family hydrolase